MSYPDPQTMTLEGLRAFLKDHLLNHLVPFWLKYGVDRKNGGLFTCIRDNGTLESRNKYIWSQARALWTFSALYHRIDKNPEYLEIAHGLFRFLKQFGRNRAGYWVFVTDEQGALVQDEASILTDCFAIMGLAEYARITGSAQAKAMALETYHSVCQRLSKPHTYKTAPYPTPPGMKPHREFMHFSFAFFELGKVLGNAGVRDHGIAFAKKVQDHFILPQREVLLEYIGMDDLPKDTPEGRCMVPGHAIESCYYQMLIFSETGMKTELDLACRAARWCFEKGWDPEYGGLFLGIDTEGKTPVYWKNAEKKIWWVHAEALAAAMMAHEYYGEDWCLAWYDRIHKWSFDHYPVREHGEWTQRLDRQGNIITDLIALPVKDPFHLPRGLIMAVESIERINKKN